MHDSPALRGTVSHVKSIPAAIVVGSGSAA